MENKHKYWWQCESESCKAKASFPDTVGAQIAAFIWDRLSRDWNQDLLLRECPRCKERRLRIAYDFPQHGFVFMVKHIVGVQDDGYLPMMWEFCEVRNPDFSQYQFNYLTGRNPRGLKTAAIISAECLRALFRLYCEKAGRDTFPPTRWTSKKLSHLMAAVDLYALWQNMCPVHQTLRVTPAMQAAITGHVWSIGELLTA